MNRNTACCICVNQWLFFYNCSTNNYSFDVMAELNKEELISGLLFPCLPPRVPYPFSNGTPYNKPDVTANRGNLPDSLYAEVHTSNEGFGTGDQLSVLPQFPVNDAGGASNCVWKPESSAAATPQEQRDARMSDVSLE